MLASPKAIKSRSRAALVLHIALIEGRAGKMLLDAGMIHLGAIRAFWLGHPDLGEQMCPIHEGRVEH